MDPRVVDRDVDPACGIESRLCQAPRGLLLRHVADDRNDADLRREAVEPFRFGVTGDDRAPSFARATAIALPMPEPAPVTIATRPGNR